MNGMLSGLAALVLGGPLLVVVSVAGVVQGSAPSAPVVASATRAVGSIPVTLRAVFADAAVRYGVPAPVLEAVAATESSFNADAVGPPVPGGPALGMMQFLPATYAAYNVVAGSTPFDAGPAVLAAARLLAADGRSARGWDAAQALFAYNHSTAYVTQVLSAARAYGYRGAPS